MQVSILPGRGADWLKHRAWIASGEFRRWLHAGWQRVASLAHEN
jgi:hypothetical protein